MSDKKFCCDQMGMQISNGLIRYDERFDEYDIVLREDDQIEVLQKIVFCPWSGDRLPQGCRDRWFDELEALGIDPLNDPIPEPYQTKQWRENHDGNYRGTELPELP